MLFLQFISKAQGVGSCVSAVHLLGTVTSVGVAGGKSLRLSPSRPSVSALLFFPFHESCCMSAMVSSLGHFSLWNQRPRSCLSLEHG